MDTFKFMLVLLEIAVLLLLVVVMMIMKMVSEIHSIYMTDNICDNCNKKGDNKSECEDEGDKEVNERKEEDDKDNGDEC